MKTDVFDICACLVGCKVLFANTFHAPLHSDTCIRKIYRRAHKCQTRRAHLAAKSKWEHFNKTFSTLSENCCFWGLIWQFYHFGTRNVFMCLSLCVCVVEHYLFDFDGVALKSISLYFICFCTLHPHTVDYLRSEREKRRARTKRWENIVGVSLCDLCKRMG